MSSNFTQNLKTLSPAHYRIMDFILAGWKLTEISKKLNISTNQIQNVKGSIVFQDEIALRRSILDDSINQHLNSELSNQEYVNNRLAEGAKAAVDKLCGLVSGPSDSIARASASDILDRAGFPKATKTENTNNSIFVMDKDDISRIEESIRLDAEPERELLVKSVSSVTKDDDVKLTIN